MLLTISLLLLIYIFLGLKKPGVAIITCPFVAGVLFMIGFSEESVEETIGGPLLLAVTITAILFSKNDPEEESWPKIFAKWFLYLCLGLVLLASMGLIFGPLGLIGVLFAIFLFSSIIAYNLTSYQAKSAFIISTIGSSIRQNLPLPMALESAASGQTDSRSKILSKIKNWLVQGYSLSESIKRGYPRCPGHAVAMIAAAERINQLPLAIQAIEANMTSQTNESRKIRPVHPIYPVLVISFTFLILCFITIFIMPQFSSTLAEMTGRAGLPAVTRFVLGITSFITLEYGWLFLIILALIVLFIIPYSIYVRFRPRRPDKPYLLSRMGDFLKWHLPILHWFEKNYSMVQVVEMLRLSLNAGCTVNDAIRNTITLDINNSFKKRLRKWLELVENGYNISKAVKESKLGPALSWAFDEQVNQGNTIAILETLESFYRTNYSYCVNLARFIMWPCIILLMGMTVATVILAIFLPSIAIIRTLSGMV